MKTYLLAGAFCLVALPAFALSFASIALSPSSGAWGRSYGFSTRGEADSTAIGYCQQHASDPDDCRVVTWSRGEYCAAVAVHHKRDGSVVWGSASGPTKEDAESKAYENCSAERHGDSCDEILASVCSH